LVRLAPWVAIISLVCALPASAAVTLSPTSLSFGNQVLGTATAAKIITISNGQVTALTISSISVTGTAAGDYSTSSNCVSPISPNATCSVSVVFIPGALATRSATLSVVHSASTTGINVGLSGIGLAAVTVSPTSLSFTKQVVTTSSPTKTLTLTNNQSIALPVISIGLTGGAIGDYAQTNTCGASLAPTSSCAINVIFSPTAVGTRSTTLSVTHGLSATPLNVAVSGSAVLALTPSLSSASFGNQVLLTPSPAKIITLVNNLSAPLTLVSVAETGTMTADFALTNGCPATLPALGTCTLSVVFTPSALGARSASIAIAHDSYGSPLSIAMSGTGINPLTTSPTSVSFTKQAINTSSSAKMVVFTNNTTAPITVGGVTTTGDYSQTNNCGSVGPGGTCTVSVVFNPTATGTRTGILSVTHSASATPLSVSLSGTAVLPVTSSVSSVSFSAQVVNTASPARTLILTNNLSTSVDVTVATAGDYSQTNNCGSVGPGGTCTVSVVFTPSALGTRSGTLTVTPSVGSPVTVTLSGSSVLAVTGSVSSLSFLKQVVNTPSTAKSVTLKNNQTVALTFTGITVTGDFSQTNDCGGGLNAGATCTVNVVFTPGTVGTRSGTLTISHDAAGGPLNVALSGPSVLPVTTSVTSLTFGNQVISTGSTAKAVTITNNQAVALGISSIAVTADYSQSNTCGTVLAAMASCTVSVVFTPAALGSRPGTLSIAHGAVNSPISIPLSGSGITYVSTSATSLSFGNQLVRSPSTARIVTLTNSQTTALTLQSIETSGSFSQTNNCGNQLSAGTSCTISVVYAPKFADEEHSALVIRDSGFGSPRSVSLDGVGIPPLYTTPAAAAGGALRFGTQFLNASSATQTVTFANSQSVAVALSGITLTGDYTQTNNCGTQVAAKASCTFTVAFRPTIAGLHNGLLTIHHNAFNLVTKISLTGIGITTALRSIHVAPFVQLHPGTVQQFTATGTNVDGSTMDLTGTAIWSSTDPSVATLTATGAVTAVAPGTARISASIPGQTGSSVSGSAALTVGELLISPRNAVLTPGQTRQFNCDSASPLIWTVDGVPGGSATVGTISAAGFYAAPDTPGPHVIGASDPGQPWKVGSVGLHVSNHPGAFTWQYDPARTGQNTTEIALTPENVNSAQFGKRFSFAVDGKIFGQPLYVPNVDIPGQGHHNVAFVVTSRDAIYAFDADGLSAAPLWQVSLLNSAAGVNQPSTGFGITGTPVIDSVARTLFLVAWTQENGNYIQRLHALDIATGAPRANSPRTISASVSGAGIGGDGNGNLAWSAQFHIQRPGLLLLNGALYLAFGGITAPPYHGWLLAYDSVSLEQLAVLNTTPNGYAGSIWMGGSAPAADSSGRIFLTTANGSFTANRGGTDFGDSVLAVSPVGGLTITDSFTPFDQAYLDDADVDLGAGGVLVLPDQSSSNPHVLIALGKSGTLYLLNRDNLGRYVSGANTQALQVIENAAPAFFSTAALWQNRIYYAGWGDGLKSRSLSNGTLGSVTANGSTLFGVRGATPVVSSDGSTNGVVWAIEANTGAAVLHAFDALDITRELYSSAIAPVSRDAAGNNVRFAVPLVVDGKVFVGGDGQLTLYGLLP
jgi:hypothetical protein